eukprot:TRINITY_DN7906_c0_g1_i1.p1 TRINITY_DN7906_c0_g1~~TRINITY_DN7906_c0_g1_i1.p1  ORF type:complete len:278 (-),score=34.26 TRINITY_DN7906_c0_g1_i1:364-1158(-)
MATTIVDLPEELVHCIAVFLDPSAICRWSETSQAFHRALTEESLWQSLCLIHGVTASDSDAAVADTNSTYRQLFIEFKTMSVRWDRGTRYEISEDGRLAKKHTDPGYISSLRGRDALSSGQHQWCVEVVSIHGGDYGGQGQMRDSDADIGLAIRVGSENEHGETGGWMRDNFTGPCISQDQFTVGTRVHCYLNCDENTFCMVIDDRVVLAAKPQAERVLVGKKHVYRYWPCVAMRHTDNAMRLVAARFPGAELRAKMKAALEQA